VIETPVLLQALERGVTSKALYIARLDAPEGERR
jgi:hypothetical protein